MGTRIMKCIMAMESIQDQLCTSEPTYSNLGFTVDQTLLCVAAAMFPPVSLQLCTLGIAVSWF